MSPTELEALGQALYGADWEYSLSVAIGHNSPRTVQRWANGYRAIPRDLGEQLVTIAKDRVREIQTTFAITEAN